MPHTGSNIRFQASIKAMSKNELKKTNAARLLDRAGIAYELIPYEVDEEHLSADAVAAKLGEDIAYVYKTIVLRGDRNGILRMRAQGR